MSSPAAVSVQHADVAGGIGWRWGAIVLALAAALGLASTHSLGLVLAVAAIPLLLGLVATRPEWILILFLTAGIYKQDPRITGVMPFDITAAMGVLLILAIAIQIFRRQVRWPGPLLLLLPLLAMLVKGLLGHAPEYGTEKALRFCTLTVLAIGGGCVLLDDRNRLQRFLYGLAVLGFLLSLDATQNSETTSEGRLTSHGSNPIALARVGALTLAFGWIRFHLAERAFGRVSAVVLLGVACLCVLGAGSRGPVLSIVLSMGLISLVSAAAHGRSPISLQTMAMVVGFAVLLISFAAIPSLPLYRFQLLFSEDKGTSIFLRGLLFATAFKLMTTHPLGLGVGEFARHAILDLKYPHNLFLEVGCELGWIPLICLMLLMGWSISRACRNVVREYSWSTLFLAVSVMASSMNAMVTGDLNDNRLLFSLLLLPFVQARHLVAARHPRDGALAGAG